MLLLTIFFSMFTSIFFFALSKAKHVLCNVASVQYNMLLVFDDLF